MVAPLSLTLEAWLQTGGVSPRIPPLPPTVKCFLVGCRRRGAAHVPQAELRAVVRMSNGVREGVSGVRGVAGTRQRELHLVPVWDGFVEGLWPAFIDSCSSRDLRDSARSKFLRLSWMRRRSRGRLLAGRLEMRASSRVVGNTLHHGHYVRPWEIPWPAHVRAEMPQQLGVRSGVQLLGGVRA